VGPLTTTISCEGVIRRLATLLDAFPAPRLQSKWPLPDTALSRLAVGPTPTDPLTPHLVALVAPILGTIGFISGAARPDAFFAYCVLSRYASVARLTQYVFDLVLRLGHYIASTKDLVLHLTTPPQCAGSLDLFDTFVDSSNGNADDGAGYGGFVLACATPAVPTPGAFVGGALAWRCSAPRAGDDSSSSAELRQATLAYKYTLAARFLLTELDVGVAPSRPTAFYLDAQAVLDGTTCERLSKGSRWMAMRYAMLRWGIMCGTIDPHKRPSASNPSDGLTKCLVGPSFIAARALLLGFPTASPAPGGDPPATRGEPTGP
jgi:hypothetical protein